ncbi:MAG: toprim domain-containing protein [Halobacteria archaeon]|nr:toprim domain-containing protein [Halobacteria archaeon]
MDWDWETPRERLRRFESVLDDISAESDDTVIVVEGRKDEEALRDLGVDGEYVRVSANGRSLSETAVRISTSYSSAVLLTDWDEHGNMLHSKLKRLLESYGVDPKTKYRGRLRSLSAKEVYDVESLSTHRTNLRRDASYEY